MRNTLNRTFQFLTRSKGISLATIAVMTITFFITALFMVAAYSSHLILSHFEAKAQVSAFFKDEASEEQILAVQKSLENTGLTAEVTYTSKEEALQIYMGRFNEDPALLESIAANILPASLDIRTKNINDLTQIAEILRQEQLVEDVIFHKDIVDRLKTITAGARLLQLFLVALLTTASAFIVLVTIALIIHEKKSEIEIMQLVGATSWQIRWPFILQGIIFGIVAASISSVILISSLPQLLPYLESALLGVISLRLFRPELVLIIVGGQLILGLILGALGSILATWRYLR